MTGSAQVHELAIEIGRIWKLMKESQEQGLLLNRRQKLLDLAVTPYEDLNRLVKEFQPYRDLWITASEWVQVTGLGGLWPAVASPRRRVALGRPVPPSVSVNQLSERQF